MSTITDADREAAHALLDQLIFSEACRWFGREPGGHVNGCSILAQALADVRVAFRRQVAAYLLDRADQIETKRWEWNPLADAAKAIVRGEVETAVAHGELAEPELLARVDGFAGRKHG